MFSSSSLPTARSSISLLNFLSFFPQGTVGHNILSTTCPTLSCLSLSFNILPWLITQRLFFLIVRDGQMCYQVRNLGVILTPSSPLLLTSYELQILLNMIQYFQFFTVYTHQYLKNKKAKRKKKIYDKTSLILALPHGPSSQTPAVVYQCDCFLIYSSGDLKNTTVYKYIYCTSLLPPVTCFTLMLET